MRWILNSERLTATWLVAGAGGHCRRGRGDGQRPRPDFRCRATAAKTPHP